MELLRYTNVRLMFSAVSPAVPFGSFFPNATYGFDVVLEEASKNHVGYRNVSDRNTFRLFYAELAINRIGKDYRYTPVALPARYRNSADPFPFFKAMGRRTMPEQNMGESHRS